MERQNGPNSAQVPAAAGAEDGALDSGYLALLGHQILNAVSAVAAALDALLTNGDRIGPADRVLLERAIHKNLLEVAEGARSLVHGEISGASS